MAPLSCEKIEIWRVFNVTQLQAMTAVTAEGMEMARRLMSNGWLNRYQPPLVEAEDEEAMDYLLQCERALAAYIGVLEAAPLGVRKVCSRDLPMTGLP